MADLDEVAALFHVHEKASAHGDLFKNIANSAMARLRAIDAEHAQPKPEVIPGVYEPEPEHDEPEPIHEEETEDHAA